NYLIVEVDSAKGGDGKMPSAEEMLVSHGAAVAQLVRGEVDSLSTAERDEILRSALSYYPNDLVVVGWAAAFVYDTVEATTAVIDLLRYANTQLLEFRFYDELLTNLLSNVYSSLEGHERLLASWRLARRAVRLNRIRLDIMELAERTEYAVKFI